ncbi:MAG: hypothetical protein AAGJ46_01865 [Planctomycetota bacterium]
MRLVRLEFEPPPVELSTRVASLLDDADGRIERLQHDRRDCPIAAFVPSDFALAYHALDRIDELGLAPGRRFLEWGSGAGVVTCLAAMLGWDAVGIEIEDPLVDIAEAIADDHEVQAEFVRGTFVPEDSQADLTDQRDINWLRTDGVDAYEWLGLEPDDFDVVFAYPWPGEEQIIFDLFCDSGAVGALLLTYHGQEGIALHRKVR